jgi:deoxyribodipyrimidine photolyase-like uncharacterized protein
MKNNNSDVKRNLSFFGQKLIVINVGIKTFYEDLKKHNVKVIHVDWKPPAGGDKEITALLDKIL